MNKDTVIKKTLAEAKEDSGEMKQRTRESVMSNSIVSSMAGVMFWKLPVLTLLIFVAATGHDIQADADFVATVAECKVGHANLAECPSVDTLMKQRADRRSEDEKVQAELKKNLLKGA